MVDKLDQFEVELSRIKSENLTPEDRVLRLEGLLSSITPRAMVNDGRRALDLSQTAYDLAVSLDYAKGIAWSNALIGFSYYLLSDHEKALPKLQAALAAVEDLDDGKGGADVLNGIAGVHLSLGNYEQALECYLKALKIAVERGDSLQEAWTSTSIGGAYHDLGDYANSLKFHHRSLEIFEAADQKVGMGRALTGIGTVYQAQGKHEQALDFHERALVLFKAAGHNISEARALNDLGTAYQNLNQPDRALAYHKRSLVIRRQIGNKQSESTSLINLGNLYVQMGQPDEALEALHRALTIGMEIKAKPRIFQANLALSEAYTLLGEHDHALAHFKEYHRVKEEVSGDQANSRIRNLQIGFEVEQSEREAEIERLRNVELKTKNEQLEQLLGELKTTQAQLVQSEKMAALGSLVAGLVHEMNSPVGAINSSGDVAVRSLTRIRQVLETSMSLNEVRDSKTFKVALRTLTEAIGVVRTADHRLSKIVQSLKSFTRLDEAVFQKVDIHEGLESTLQLVKSGLVKDIRVERKYGDLPHIACYPAELNQVFMHLLSNAINAIDRSGVITIETLAQKDSVRIVISDTGIGIPKEQLERLFDPSFTRTGSRVKAGLGLFTSHNIIRKHRGEFKVRSEIGRGTTFTVVLPTNLKDGMAAA